MFRALILIGICCAACGGASEEDDAGIDAGTSGDIGCGAMTCTSDTAFDRASCSCVPRDMTSSSDLGD